MVRIEHTIVIVDCIRSIERMVMALLQGSQTVGWMNRIGRVGQLVLDRIGSSSLKLVRRQHIIEKLHSSRSIGHKEMVQILVGIVEFERHRSRVQRLVVRSIQSIGLEKERIARSFQITSYSNSIEHMEMALPIQRCRFQWLHHTSKRQRWGFRIVESRQLEWVRTQRRFGWVHAIGSIVECMGKVLQCSSNLE